jgi:hypothetical protein
MPYWEKPAPGPIIVTDEELLQWEIENTTKHIHKLKDEIEALETYRIKLKTIGVSEVPLKEAKREMIKGNKEHVRRWKAAGVAL